MRTNGGKAVALILLHSVVCTQKLWLIPRSMCSPPMLFSDDTTLDEAFTSLKVLRNSNSREITLYVPSFR